MSFGSFTAKKKSTAAKPKGEVQFQRIPIDIRGLAETRSTGPKIALLGKAFTGKSGAMLSSVYLNTEYKDIYSEKYPATAAALKSGFLPEVESIFVIESENTLENQINNALGLPWFQEVKDKIQIVALETAARRDKMNRDRTVEVDLGSIEKIEQVHDQYIQCAEHVETILKDNYNAAVGLDSGSRLYNLLNQKNQILIQRRTPRGSSDQTVERIRQSAWEWRNSWWDEIFTKLRGHKGYTFCTFMMKETPKQYRAEGDPPSKPKWVNGTEFNFDQIYELYTDYNGLLSMKINQYFGSRYRDRSSKQETSWNLDTDGRLSIFPAIEDMVKLAGEW
jgi:hypothetical protein